MEFRHLTPSYAVSPQLTPEDIPHMRAAGFTVLINNRPDAEVPAAMQGEAMRAACVAHGVTYVENPVVGGAITMRNVRDQGEAIATATGPILAYCASGNRSAITWALSQAGTRATEELITVPARFGYQLEPYRPQLEALARTRPHL